MLEALVLFIAVQALRYLIFEHGFMERFWRRFSGVPLLGSFLNCSFCQGFWMGLVAFLPFTTFIYAVAWGLVSGWFAASWSRWMKRNDDDDEKEEDAKPSRKHITVLEEEEEGESDAQGDAVILLECNIDDMSGEFFGDIMQRLFALGALDVWFTSAYGKKNRPLYQLSALVSPEDEENAVRTILTHTSTGGVRRRCTRRIVMRKSFISVALEGTSINVKRLSWKEVVKYTPEWEDCAEASRKLGRPVAEIYNEAAALAYKIDPEKNQS